MKLVSTPNLDHRYQVVRTDGLPDVPLTLFASDLLKSLSPSSVPIYMREVLAAFEWAQSDEIVLRNHWSLLGPPAEVRNVLREYLTVAAKCKLTTRADRLGVKVTYVCQTSETGINIRILLAALRRFYDYLISSEGYVHANPLLQEQMDQIKADLRNGYRQAVRAAEGRDPMPSVSGVDPPFGIRLSANFFRCVDREWIPRTIDDPDFPHLVYDAGKEYGWGLRELCVVRMLFESGARISEILDLTALDWSVSQFMNQFVARNKGSFGIRTKRLVVSSATAKLCRRYFDNDTEGRRAHDRLGLTLNDLTKLDSDALGKVPLFLTNRGTVMGAKTFRHGYWTPALRAANIHANPHLARHWFVTNALRMIEKTSKDENETFRRKAELVQYMGWRTAERTLKAYEHVTRDVNFVVTTLTAIHGAMKKREDAIKKDPEALSRYQPVEQPNAARREDPELALLTGVYQ
jgi:site-specific recombinase XerD